MAAAKTVAPRTITIPFNFVPRGYQLPLLRAMDSGATRGVAIWHRRAGKDRTCFNYMIKRSQQQVGTYHYLFPTYGQAKKVIWEGIGSDGFPMLGHAPAEVLHPRGGRHDTDLKLTFRNGSIIQLIGADSYDSVIGTNPIGTVWSEYSLQNPSAWDYYRPILRENGGWAIFNYTPRGRNHGWDMFERAKQLMDGGDKAWFVSRLSVEDTGVLGAADIEAERREGMDEEMIAQEFYCFPPDAMVTCADRAKPISDVAIGDIVVTHTGRMRSVTATMSRPYGGDLVTIESWGGRPVTCTPNHPLRVCDPTAQTYAWKSAGEVTVDDWLVTPKMSIVKPIISAHLARVIGWYIAEGSASKGAVQFTLGPGEPQNVAALRSALGSLGYRSTETPAATAVQIIVCDAGLADFLIGACGSTSDTKRLPLSLIRGYEDIVWEALIAGDGCIHQPANPRYSPTYHYTTISEGLAAQVHLLGSALGFVGTYTDRESQAWEINGRSGIGRPSYSVQMRRATSHDKRGRKTLAAKHAMIGRVRSIARHPYVGTVHNLSVAIDESYVVGGRAVHNCSFEGSRQGSIYGKQLAEAEAEGRICSVPWQRDAKVNTWWDIGTGDPTAIWFTQDIGREIHVIDYYENSGVGVGVDHYVRHLRGLPYIYGAHNGPHDLNHHQFAANGKSAWEVARALGLMFEVVPDVDRTAGINAGRALMGRCWFDRAKTEKGRKALAEYHYAWDDKRKMFLATPYHDWASNGADAWRYLGVGHKHTPNRVREKVSERGQVVQLGNAGTSWMAA